jgi:hypothetical protein
MIKDLRNRDTCPCLKNFAKMPTAELKELCILAYDRQMKALVETEGDEAKLLQELKTELKEVKAVNAERGDREAKKFENAFGK